MRAREMTPLFAYMDDSQSVASLSGISDTDDLIFRRMANADRVDLRKEMDPIAEATPEVRIEDITESQDDNVSVHAHVGAQESRQESRHEPFTSVSNDPPQRKQPQFDEDDEWDRDKRDLRVDERRGRDQWDSPPREGEGDRGLSSPRDDVSDRDRSPSRGKEDDDHEHRRYARRGQRDEVEDDASDMSDHSSRPRRAESDEGTVRREEEELAKRTVLADLHALGVPLSREWTMDDRVEDMMLELRRHALVADEKKNVGMMRDGLKLFASGVELLNNRLGLLDLDGWSTELARDLPKHDASIARIYRKYWRRGSSNSPEADLAFAVLGSMSMHHIKRTMSKSLMQRSARRGGPAARPRSPEQDSSSDEEAP